MRQAYVYELPTFEDLYYCLGARSLRVLVVQQGTHKAQYGYETGVVGVEDHFSRFVVSLGSYQYCV